MKIVIADDEQKALKNMMQIIHACVPDAQAEGFRFPEEALEYAVSEQCDIAFLDIEMYETSGVSLAEEMIKKIPGINIIFTTAYSEYSLDALQLHASGYILKPVTEEKVKKELEHLRYQTGTVREEPNIRVQTFGNFEIFYREEPVDFYYQKTKELIAFLIDKKGAMCANNEIEVALWEGDPDSRHTSYLKNIKRDLKETFARIGEEKVLVTGRRGVLGIVKERIDCDYYHLLEGNREAQMKYTGEYMSQYSWAEFTNAWLQGMMKR